MSNKTSVLSATTQCKSLEEAENILQQMARDWTAKVEASQKAGLPNFWMTYGGVWSNDGSCLIYMPGGGCHGYVNTAFYNARQTRKECSFVLSVYLGDLFTKYGYNNHPAVCSEELQRKFIRWFISDDMPLSKHILIRDENFIYNYGLIVDGTCGHSKTLFLCKVLRQAHENPTITKLWERLVDDGVDPMFALKFANNFCTEAVGDNYTFTQTAHCCSFPARYERGMKNLITRTIKDRQWGVSDGGTCYSVFLDGGACEVTGKNLDAKMFSDMKTEIDNGWGGKTVLQGVPYRKILELAQDWEGRIRASLKPVVTKTIVKKSTTVKRSKKLAS